MEQQIYLGIAVFVVYNNNKEYSVWCSASSFLYASHEASNIKMQGAYFPSSPKWDRDGMDSGW